MNFSDWLQDQILRSGHNRKEIAQLMNRFPKRRLDKICNGACPSSYEVIQLSKALGIDPDEMEDVIAGKESNLEPVNIHPVADLKEANDKAEKPGVKAKSAKIKNSTVRLHDIKKPDVLICHNCDEESDDCCFCHPEDDEIKFLFGLPGTGGKSPDELAVLLCLKCRTIMDKKPNIEAPRVEKLEHSILWAKAIIKKLISQK